LIAYLNYVLYEMPDTQHRPTIQRNNLISVRFREQAVHPKTFVTSPSGPILYMRIENQTNIPTEL